MAPPSPASPKAATSAVAAPAPRSTRGTLRALVHKNWIVKKRHPIATLSEVLNPLICILLFAGLKTLEPDLAISSGWSTDASNRTDSSRGSSWDLFAKQDLMATFNATISDAGLAANKNTTQPNLTLASLSGSSLAAMSLASGLAVPYFYFTESTVPGLLLNMGLQSMLEADHLDRESETDVMFCFINYMLFGFTSLDPSSSFAVPPICHGRVVPYKIAITPNTTYTRNYFARLLELWHPRIALVPGLPMLTVPSFMDSYVMFENESVLEDYVAGPTYGRDLNHPKIYASISFQTFPQNDNEIGDVRGQNIDFSIRMNSTYTDTSFPGSVPRTIGRRFSFDKYLRAVKPLPTMCYATRGFMTLQTAVMRFLNCMPTWDPVKKTTDGTCQIKASVAPANDTKLNARLLHQFQNDLFVGSIFTALNTLKAIIVRTAEADPSLAQSLGFLLPAIRTLQFSLDRVPDRSKEDLLLPLRQAPQAYHGGGVFLTPILAFNYAGFYDKIVVVFPVGFILSYLYSVSRIIVALLSEKETRAREFMRILGVPELQIGLAWFLFYVVLLLVASVLQTIGACKALFPNSDGGLLFGLFFTFALSSWGYAFLVSSLFSRARAGSLVGMGVFFMIFFVSFALSSSASEQLRMACSLLSPVALAQAIQNLAAVEAVSVGITSANAYDPINNFSFINAIRMQLLDFVLYVLLGLYFERVIPKEYGVPEPWYFVVSPTYWRRVWSKAAQTNGVVANADLDTPGKPDACATAAVKGVEDVGDDLRQQELDGRAVLLRELRKVYHIGGGTKVAVQGISVAFYEGQVACLLGHNGAGKTTVMSMLTGMTPVTSGDARINGFSITTDMRSVRRSLGYCPQFSVLYPELTVEEHLVFYAQVKGLAAGSEALQTGVARKIADVGLTEKRHVWSSALSGGMKRKLSLAVAFLGDSRVVFLDEPTSGMDPYSRRSTWDLIRSNRRGRVILLTTHFMDEADILGDRIAIMADGVLQCVGSSLFLKQRFGVGYRLSFVQMTRSEGGKTSKAATDAHAHALRALIQTHVHEAKLATDVGTELTFQLPFEASSRFPKLFEALDAQQQALGIESYAISVTTLEEIFLKVAETHAAEQAQQALQNKAAAKEAMIDDKVDEVATSMPTDDASHTSRQHSLIVWFIIQLHALLLKRFWSARRDGAMVFYSTLLPAIVLFVGLTSLKLSLFIKNDPKVMLTAADQLPLGANTPIPFACPTAVDGVCTQLFAAPWFDGGAPSSLDVPVPAYPTTTPVVFGLSYVNASIEPNDTTGLAVRFGELVFERGYGVNASTDALLPGATPVDGQSGGYLAYTSTPQHLYSYNVIVNSSATHGAPTFKALVDQAVHRRLLDNSNVSVRVATHPFPLSTKTRSIFNSFLSLPAVIFVVVAFTFIPAAIMPFLVKERWNEQNSKHQQLLSGVSLPAFWVAHWVFDYVLYLVPMTIALLLLRGSGISTSLSHSQSVEVCPGCTQDVRSAVSTLFLLFGGAVMSWTYLLSHVLNDPNACLLYTIMINFFVGLLLLLVSYSLNTVTSTRPLNASLIYIWRLSPLFCLGQGLLQIIIADIEALYGLSDLPRSAYDAQIAGNELAYLAAEIPIYFIAAVLLDMAKTGDLRWLLRSNRTPADLVDAVRRKLQRFVSRDKSKLHAQEAVGVVAPADDDDVMREAQRIYQGAANGAKDDDEVVRIVQLRKTYANGKCAVANLSFGLSRGECFGFLGINGAGKTTTMKMLTGDLFPTSGTAKLNGFDIVTERQQVRHCIGYCPQFDALLDLLTVNEHLQLFGRLKGFNGVALQQEMKRLVRKLQLTAFANKLAGSLSGGNKRKLSVAIAMLGNPPLLFLDEPSTGMDPFARRFLWDVILRASVQSRHSTIMLTTHAMDECEALCSKAAIMVGGRLRCLGSIPYLKARFGDGFLVECKFQATARTALEQLKGELVATAASSTLTREALAVACDTLHKPERFEWIVSDAVSHPTGAGLGELLARNGALDVDELCLWWLLEDRVEQMKKFLHKHFGVNAVTLLERQADYCRFKLAPSLTPSDDSVDANETNNDLRTRFALARMFQLIEDSRVDLGVQEYSIAQTSLEQIFHSFARHNRKKPE
ncbi:TPA: hypothetical protein N0F65_002017 [Lagenidium giganteum]|uniref:ABC transporter domain-containing protein n=1 Tax=Lagenidium giganteum TaxID=4803 RepID=A0AAV2Z3N5_9STRA|nr:TPA: hypothetical protein N0F65_002017 [Lagenidium giganteum]